MIAVLCLGTSAGAAPPSAADARDRGLKWLAFRQEADGSWRSDNYAALRHGVGLTALVLRTLAETPDGHTTPVFESGLRFLTARRDEQDFVCSPTGETEYRVYSTALTLTALRRQSAEQRTALARSFANALKNSQRTALRGWSPDDPDFSGWSPTGQADELQTGDAPSNLAVTAAVLDALAGAEMLSPDVRRDATVFVHHCQNLGDATHGDGGFFFTPRLDDPLNKLMSAPTSAGQSHPRSYFSATCDGLIGGKCLELEPRRLEAAAAWLDSAEPPAFREAGTLSEEAPPKPLESLSFYSAAAFARCWKLHPERHVAWRAHRDFFVKALVERQRPDGSWRNPVASMREDDPVIATAFAVFALSGLDE